MEIKEYLKIYKEAINVNVSFDEEKHRYINNVNGRELISVTQLLSKHGLAPDYSGVTTSKLNECADFGTRVHKAIENYNKRKQITDANDFTMKYYIDWYRNNNIECLASEYIVANDIIAGTFDFIFNYDDVDGDERYLTLVDVKTTSTIHTEAVSWQLSIYRNLLGYRELKNGSVLVFDKQTSRVEEKTIKLKSWEEVEALIQAERENVIYQPQLKDLQAVKSLTDLQIMLDQYKERQKQVEAQMQEFKDKIIEEMQQRGIKKCEFETEIGKITFTLVDEAKKESVDVNRLKKDFMPVYEVCKKTTITKAYLKIATKEE